MEAVGRLAGGVAHEFNNMLQAILGNAAMAMMDVPPASPLRSHLEEIQKAADHSAELTRQLLAFARKQTAAPKILDLNETVEGMLKMLRRLLGGAIALAWLPGKNPGLVKMDPSQIGQILINLCVNARDAMGDTGRITIKTDSAHLDQTFCTLHPGAAPGEHVLLAVSDDGCGMDHETIAHLFEPFFTTKEIGKGTGLGLATVYGIVKQNNGFIEVRSEPGQGTNFRIYLPRHLGKTVPKPLEAAKNTVLQGRETILVVEDEPMILKMIRSMLQLHGYVVQTAATPGEAIRLAREGAGTIRLLLTDVIMPEMNGGDLATILVALHPGLKCLFMSGYPDDIVDHRGVLNEDVRFLQKPFSMKDMLEAVRDILDGEGGCR
jgi:CheY-like chemotaxis protein